jgi:3-keto-5-aminohexanoate cleavage enzyme
MKLENDSFPLSLCPTGMVPRREDSPHVPLDVNEIVDQVLECVELGITSAHIHARNSSGEPAWQRDYYAEIFSKVRAVQPSLVLCATTSGRIEPDVEKRADVLTLSGELKPDMASLTLSSMNFANSASVNSPKVIATLAERMLERGIKPELEIFDTGMVNYASYLHSKGLLKPPFVANLLLGGIATAQVTPLDLGSMVSRLPAQTIWLVAGIGRSQLSANAMGLAAGGGVRVGLEDNLHFDNSRKRLATNLELVKRVIDIGQAMNRPVMSPAEFRQRFLID